MKKIYTLFAACLTFAFAHAASYTISISGTSYSPNTLTVSIGDVITIQASAAHPLAQVDGTTWNANGTATLSSGWGTKTADHTFTVSSVNTIYYVCTMHVGLGMKGQIAVTSTGLHENSFEAGGLSVFPVPAKESISLNYTLSETGLVNIALVGLNGQIAATLLNEVQLAGKQERKIDLPSALASGLYILQVSSNQQNRKQQLISIQ